MVFAIPKVADKGLVGSSNLIMMLKVEKKAVQRYSGPNSHDCTQ